MNDIVNRIPDIVASQRTYFRSQATLDVEHRLEMLRKLRNAIVKHEQSLTDALYLDLHKSYEEAYLTEISIVLGEIDNFLKHLKGGQHPRSAPPHLSLSPQERHHHRTPRRIAHHSAMELPRAVTLEPTRGCYSGRMHRSIKTLAICTECISGIGKDD